VLGRHDHAGHAEDQRRLRTHPFVTYRLAGRPVGPGVPPVGQIARAARRDVALLERHRQADALGQTAALIYASEDFQGRQRERRGRVDDWYPDAVEATAILFSARSIESGVLVLWRRDAPSRNLNRAQRLGEPWRKRMLLPQVGALCFESLRHVAMPCSI